VEKRRLGESDLEVSLVGLGTNNFGLRMDREAARPVIHKALDLGITHIDTADIYGGAGESETIIGEVLGPRRKETVLATKFGKRMANDDTEARGARDYVLSAVEASLKRLQTDWIDLLWMHEPDPNTSIEETFAAVEELRKAGKIRHLAASNFSGTELDEAAATAKRMGITGFIACQDEYSLLVRGVEDTIYPAMETLRLSLVPYFPLAGGALTGKYRKGETLPQGSRLSGGSARFLDPYWDKIASLVEFAEARGRAPLELAMSWLANRPPVASIIAGAMTTTQLEENAKSVEWALTQADMAEIDRLTQ
jgi:aryl-alcohol dehydrogenase-like predicted oxidoreductase